MTLGADISFGDNVRILRSPETERLGIAEKIGNVYGETTPSETNVAVIGKLESDYALNVYFDFLDASYWLAPHMLEFVSHAPGTEVHVHGSPFKSVHQRDGSWKEVPVNDDRAPGIDPPTTNGFLLAGAALSGTAALLHLGCIAFGAPWYRFLGAGEQMAQMASAGHWYPAAVTLVMAAMLATWSLYALSGAGVIARLPLLRFGLCAITAAYLLRAVGFLPLMRYFPDNSWTFWIVSSGICLVLGIVHAIGLSQTWSRL